MLVDVCMPELDGFELAAMIRQHPRFQKTAIIFVSAVMMTDLDRLRGYQSGAVDYVPVPVVPEILRAKVSVFAELYRKTRELEQLNAELEQRVAERTAELEATTAALREADRRKDEFLAMLAHELRNPLAPIRTAVQLLRLKELPEAHSARARDIIERQVEHLVRLIDDLLDVSRITRGMITLQREPVPASAIVARAVEIDAAGDRRQAARAGPRPARRAADGRRRRDAAGAGRRQHPAQRRQVHGAGRPHRPARDARGRVGRDRRQGRRASASRPIAIDASSTCSRRSTARADGAQGGLGHRPGAGPAARRDARRHRRRPQRRAGPRHRVPRLPAADDRDAASRRGRAAARRRSTPRRCRRTPARRILVADDNGDAADRWRCGCELAGHDVRTAHDGAEALAVARTFQPEVVLLDLGMPKMDGYETARHLRRLAVGQADAPDRAHRLGTAAGSPAARPRPASTSTW